MKKEELKDLIDSLELYSKLISDEFPRVKEDTKEIASTLKQLKIESQKVTNIGTLLIELKETFNDIQKKLSENENQSRKVELIVKDYNTLKNQLNIIYALLFGFFAGYAVNIFLTT